MIGWFTNNKLIIHETYSCDAITSNKFKKKRLFSFCCIGVVFKFQVAFYEILNELWVRNGLQIKGQAMTYIQCNFCNSMVDADLYLLQIACSRTCPNEFVTLIINSYVFLLSI